MTKILAIAAIAFGVLLLGVSCVTNTVFVSDYGAHTTLTPMVGGFQSIDISAPIKARIRIGDSSATPAVKLSGYQNILKYITVKVEKNCLYISTSKHWNISFRDDDSMVADITLPSLSELSIEGSGDATLLGSEKGGNLSVDIAGSGSVDINYLEVNSFEATVSGSGNVRVQGGNVPQATYRITGSGAVNAYALRAANCVTDITGSGNAEVYASDKLTLTITGSGDISYKGHPSVSQEVTGSGSISNDN